MPVSSKIVRVFVFSFLGVFLPLLANIAIDASETVDWSLAKSALVSAVFAAFAAAIRAVVAYLPILPDDNVGLKRTP